MTIYHTSVTSTQAGTTCGASSQLDLIQNHFLIVRMLRFLCISSLSAHFLILCPFPNSLSISSFSVHFLILSPFLHSLSISSQPSCKAATIPAALLGANATSTKTEVFIRGTNGTISLLFATKTPSLFLSSNYFHKTPLFLFQQLDREARKKNN